MIFTVIVGRAPYELPLETAGIAAAILAALISLLIALRGG